MKDTNKRNTAQKYLDFFNYLYNMDSFSILKEVVKNKINKAIPTYLRKRNLITKIGAIYAWTGEKPTMSLVESIIDQYNQDKIDDEIRVGRAEAIEKLGPHYQEMKIQPLEFIQENEIPFCEGNAIKYICRHRRKNGKEDLLKAITYIKKIIEKEYK